ncbi:MAG: helix-turn-helix domain-containing protein [Acidobacteriota bacterium]|nr:helix-turn-helix domain-containing protein [Acidobacteriota bacterium]MDE3189537.1 helix-turn-helix domain-containing protein [Acidobacteriota bacterium]
MPPETPSPAGETIGQRLKRLRLERGLSQRELAAPGVSYAYISRIEAGTRQPSVKALRKLAGKLGVTADYLESGSELDAESARELRLADLELAIRLGDADGSEPALKQILADAEAAADAPSAFRARVALAAVREEQNDLAAAIELLEAAVGQEFVQPTEHVDVFSQLGRAYSAVGRTAQAVELFEMCLDASTNSPSAEARFALMLSYALTDAGEVARAEDVVRDALAHVGDTDDPYMRVRLYWSMARVADAEGRPSLALANIRKAIALLEMTEDALNLGRAHSVAARLLVERGKGPEATEHLDRAERLLGVSPSPTDIVELKIQRSRIARLDGDTEGAILFARQALAIESMPADRGYALAVLADGLALKGEAAEADAAYREAVEILEAEGRFRPAANTARSWGNMLRAGGDEARALDALDRAAELGMRAAPQHTRNG